LFDKQFNMNTQQNTYEIYLLALMQYVISVISCKTRGLVCSNANKVKVVRNAF
jgi:hypothetical protein